MYVFLIRLNFLALFDLFDAMDGVNRFGGSVLGFLLMGSGIEMVAGFLPLLLGI